MACEYCELIEKKKNILYEDDKLVCVLAEQPATAGHIMVIPKQHKPIFEMIEDSLAGYCFTIANKMSIALFESIKAQGTNMITHNGVPAGQEVPHFCIHVIARRQGDGLLFEWLPKKLSEEEMGQVEMQLKQELEKKKEVQQVPASVGKEKPDLIKKEAKTEETDQDSEGREKKENTGNDHEGNEVEGKKPEGKEPEEEENYLVKQLRRVP